VNQQQMPKRNAREKGERRTGCDRGDNFQFEATPFRTFFYLSYLFTSAGREGKKKIGRKDDRRR